MSEEILSLLARIEERLANHVDRYDRDREEITTRVQADKKEQKEFRDGIIRRVDDLDQKIDPVVADHRTIMRIVKWTGAGGTVTLLAYIWNHLKDGLRP
jgi:hypothetical protein